MVQIEYNGTQVNVPESWEDITLGMYEQIYALKPGSTREQVELVARICGINPEVLLGWPAEIFNLIVNSLLFLYGDHSVPPSPTVEIDGVTYVVPIDDELSLGAWVDAEDAQRAKDNPLSATLAIVCRPAGEKYDDRNNEIRQKMFEALPVSKILGVMTFFLHCKTVSEQHTRIFGELHRAYDLLPGSTEILRSLGAGIKLSRIWPVIKYCYLTALLRYRLRRFSPSYNTAGTKITQKKRKGN